MKLTALFTKRNLFIFAGVLVLIGIIGLGVMYFKPDNVIDNGDIIGGIIADNEEEKASIVSGINKIELEINGINNTIGDNTVIAKEKIKEILNDTTKTTDDVINDFINSW